MFRRLFTITSVLSLLLCVATCVLWVRSYSGGDAFEWQRGAGGEEWYLVQILRVGSVEPGSLRAVFFRSRITNPDPVALEALREDVMPVGNRFRHARHVSGRPFPASSWWHRL